MRTLACILVAVVAPGLLAQSPVLTGGYDPARTNSDLSETALNPSTVSPNVFGRLFTLPADGQIFAQPLYLPNVAIPGQGSHNVVFIATAHNTVYAYDADNAAPPLWSLNLGPAVPSATYDTPDHVYTDITPEIGILSTPVIDPSTSTIYVAAATLENGLCYYRLHALDVTSGAEKFNGPAMIGGAVSGAGEDSINGVVAFSAAQHLQRPALLLLNGVVYMAFGSHGDSGTWHGWIMGYSAADLQRPAAVFNSTPNGYGGSFWDSGRGLSADGQGSIYAVTANGTTDEISDFSENVLKLNSALTVTDWFAPSDAQTLNDDDGDLGASGAILIPGNFLLTGGKQGIAYLLNSASLGHMSANNSTIPQSFPAADVGIYNMAVWNRSTGPVLYLAGGNAPVEAFSFSGNQFVTTPSSLSASGYAVAFNGMTISANGGTPGSGILWMITADSWPLPSTGTLHAFNADNLAQELWNSSLNIGRDALGEFTKFANPTVANGKVYAPTSSGALAVYGELPVSTSSAPTITGIVNAASYAGGSVAPGEIVDIFGQNLGPQTIVTGAVDALGNLSANVAGTQVTFNGVPAPILYAQASVVSAVVPFAVPAAAPLSVQVSADGGTSSPETFSVADTAPGIFTDDASGTGQAAVLNEDYSLNSDANPAAPGSIVILYATGGGATTPVSGELTASTTATVGGQPATVLYAGQAGGEIAGAVQVNLQLPGGVSGDLTVVLNVGGVSSQSTATIAVQPSNPSQN